MSAPDHTGAVRHDGTINLKAYERGNAVVSDLALSVVVFPTLYHEHTGGQSGPN